MRTIRLKNGFEILAYLALAAAVPAISAQDACVSLTSPVLVHNQVQMWLMGESRVSYTIESSTDLQDWTAVLTNTDASIARLIVLDAPDGTRFYRASRNLLTVWASSLAAQGLIDVNGGVLLTDSFDSADPNFSTNGLYDPAKAKATGDVVTDSTITNSLNVGRVKIQGMVRTGPNRSPSFGTNYSVGDAAWVNAGMQGIEPGHLYADMNVCFPDASLPPATWQVPPVVNTNIHGLIYKYYLVTGDWLMNDLSASTYVDGDVRIYVPPTGSINLNGNAGLYIAPGSMLKMFAASPTNNFSGNGVINGTGDALNFIYFGLPSNTLLQVGANASFVGAIYCPAAHFSLGGGGANTYSFVGAIVAKTIKLNGKFSFHYDESLGRVGLAR